MPELTEEQQAIVDHDGGPALVFAVAGAGKTTAMVHRIERLVREGVFPARQILATSFSRASVRDIRDALAQWPHCAGVQASTLHSVGWGILKAAARRGLLPPAALSSDDGGDGAADGRVLGMALAQARRDRADYSPELEDLDRQDFLNYVGVCKANLRYADLERAGLPDAAQALARQAVGPAGAEWYLDLYRVYEQVRRREGLLTFDDMLLSGWECLLRFPDVLAEARDRCGCVLVDEFQDVNLVQSEILDLLTRPHRHYMAIGDDDQTIYEWRGADPGFILDFGRRYGAQKYLISDNFRSHAAHLALANRVIERNVRREPKRLSLTQGFAGRVLVHAEDSVEAQGRHVARQIKQCLAGGRRPDEIAVLVRLYAQTPFIEQALVGERIPYQVVGSSPFYQRPEVQPLIDYLRLAFVERNGRTGPRPDGEQAAFTAQVWSRVANRPNRYLSNAVSEGVSRTLAAGRLPPSQALSLAADALPDRPAAALRKMADTLRWLADVLDEAPAGDALQALDARLGFLASLRRSGGPESGDSRVMGAQAFLRYAAGQGTAADLLRHMDTLAFEGAGRVAAGGDAAVRLLTVFRAKGLQWPVVFVPDCHQGTFPHGGPDALEEERRLFYVALTRPQTDLHLHLVKGERVSQFLAEADWERTLAAVEEVRAALTQDHAAWGTRETLALARHTPALHLGRFFLRWLGGAPGEARGIADRVRRLCAVAQAGGLSERLGLSAGHGTLWDMFGPPAEAPVGDHYGDLSEFCPALPSVIEAPPPDVPAPRPAGALAVGDRVRHPVHGDGTVIETPRSFGSPHLKVQFAKGSPVTLQAKFVSRPA